MFSSRPTRKETITVTHAVGYFSSQTSNDQEVILNYLRSNITPPCSLLDSLEKRQSWLHTWLVYFNLNLVSSSLQPYIKNSHMPHNHGHGSQKFKLCRGVPTYHMTSSRSAETILHLGTLRSDSESRCTRHSTMVKQNQQDLPACRHPDSSRAYLVSGHDG